MRRTLAGAAVLIVTLLSIAPAFSATKQPAQPRVKGVAQQGTEQERGQAKVDAWERAAEARGKNPPTSVSLEFTPGELQAVTREAVRRLKDAPLDPESITVATGNGQVVVSARVVRPAKFRVVVYLTARLNAGRLEASVVRAKVGWLPLSGSYVERLAGDIFGSRWRQELNPVGFSWDKFSIAETVVMSGHRQKLKR